MSRKNYSSNSSSISALLLLMGFVNTSLNLSKRFARKTKSRAALTEQIKKQFKDQLEAGKKQNEELQKKLQALTNNQEEEINITVPKS